ncbi:MAG TPA: hypothetical protein VFA79_01480 [Myxococcales bacterium]|nr:hypothetical protein [Myxococcales bacterium]
MDPIWTQLGQSRERGPEIFDVEVAVDPGRRAHVAMAQQALYAMSIDAGAQEQRCGRVPKIVEAHRPRDGLRPQCASSRLREGFAGAVGALEALRAVALPVVALAFLVPAPAAEVLVALDEARASKGRAQDLLGVCLGRSLRAIGRGKDERARRVLDLVLENWQQRRRDRNQVRVPALGGVALV